ncbi:TIGR04211 family SH3 domain-containing protein [Thermodesulforhabdus norvegica]|uniref:SH3 domain protein n=1 Tax=Thermodesulforhabdus norvegica TaxID=39841 RepID=A0A1I4SEU2_9BACT|nr:TIGR04211 family SH3 domain-containing protein [Thermodesulforhabdus norvegica]SFM62996.1 SH3 domain protein [Thermodesulforhabdus norvegica]
MRSLSRAVAGFFLLLLFSNTAHGKTVYVNDYIEITLRSGPGTDYKVIGMLPSGTALELRDSNEGWSFVVPLEGPFKGKEGWVLTRYVTTSKPRSLQIDELVKENEELKTQIANYTRQIDDLTRELSSVRGELETTKVALRKMENDYHSLRVESADFLKLKSEYRQLKERFSAMNENYEKIIRENEKLRRSQNIKWFLAGSGVFFLGWLIGAVTGRKRTRRSSIYLK